MSPGIEICEYCGAELKWEGEPCACCGRPSRFPNVHKSQEQEEQDALDKRYRQALARAKSRGADSILADFERAVQGKAHAVTACDSAVATMIDKIGAVYHTYHKLLADRHRGKMKEPWHTFRTAIDEALFPSYRDKVRFASLSLDGKGLSNYGDCLLVWDEEMIAHRASLFDQNVALYFRDREAKAWDLQQATEPGHRADWQNRAKLAAAKCAEKIGPEATEDDFEAILCAPGPSKERDDYVEVHIFGYLAKCSIASGHPIGVAFSPANEVRLEAMQQGAGHG